MATNNQLIEIIPKATLHEQEVLNVFHYQLVTDAAGDVPLLDLAQEWGILYDTMVLPALSTFLQYNTVVANNLTDLAEFAEGVYAATGDSPGETLPAHDTISVKLLRQTKSTRNGRKSFSGIAEALQNNGNIILGVSFVTDIETFCGQPLQFDDFPSPGDTTFLNPIILRKDNAPGVPYDPLTATWTNVIGAQMNTKVKTQNTRKT